MKVLVVGSSVIDLFLKVEEKEFYQLKDNKISFNLGDKIPLDIKTMTIGGNGANISVGLERLGIKNTLFTYLGSDILSKQIEDVVEREGIKLIAEKDEAKNSSLSLIFDFAEDRIIFSHHQKRNHRFEYDQETPDFIFLTSIGTYWEEAYKDVLSYVKNNDIPLAFSPGIHQLGESHDLLLETIKTSEMVFLNRDEAEKITNIKDINVLLNSIKAYGPKIVSITDGKNGAYAIDDNFIYKISPFGEKLVEKTGAGDAYSSAFFASYVENHDTKESMKQGSINAYKVMQHVGSEKGLATKNEIIKEMENNKEFEAIKISV